jgi:putative dimethyl sulfoxide reductase chaperone
MKRIYMLSRQPMFSQGVENLLMQQPGLEIVGRETHVEAALQKIYALQPDIVILDSKDMESAPASIITSILKGAPCSKIITLNLENDRVRVYLGEQRSARTIDDLLEVVFEEMPGPSQISRQEWASLANGRAQAYGFQALVYSRRVDPALLENLGMNSIQLIGSLEQVEDLTGDLRDGMQAIERYLNLSSNRSPEEVRMELVAEHARLFQPGPSAELLLPTCESYYTSCDSPGSLSIHATLNGIYESAGLSLNRQLIEKPDFIACELAFLQTLCSREAAAWENSERRMAVRIQAVETSFVKDHLVKWVPRFCDALQLHTRHDFFLGMSHLTKGFILNEAYRVAELMEVTAPEDPDPFPD